MGIIFAGVVNTGITGKCVRSITRAFCNSTLYKSVLAIVETRIEYQV